MTPLIAGVFETARTILSNYRCRTRGRSAAAVGSHNYPRTRRSAYLFVRRCQQAGAVTRAGCGHSILSDASRVARRVATETGSWLSTPRCQDVLVKHLSTAELEAGLSHVRDSPSDGGAVVLIARRPAVDEREVLTEATLDVEAGLAGDTWPTRASSRTADGSPHPGMQVTLMNSRAALLIAHDLDRRVLDAVPLRQVPAARFRGAPRCDGRTEDPGRAPTGHTASGSPAPACHPGQQVRILGRFAGRTLGAAILDAGLQLRGEALMRGAGRSEPVMHQPVQVRERTSLWWGRFR
jgi:hypothetical protein